MQNWKNYWLLCKNVWDLQTYKTLASYITAYKQTNIVNLKKKPPLKKGFKDCYVAKINVWYKSQYNNKRKKGKYYQQHQ